MARRFVLLGCLLVAGAVQAQSVPSPQPSDSWNRPAPASTAGYHEAVPAGGRSSASHFTFKQRAAVGLPGNAAQEQSGKAKVGGMGEIGRDGRPAVDCPATPMDPACH